MEAVLGQPALEGALAAKLHRPRPRNLLWRSIVSIVRVGLAETKKFADGYDAIFGKKKAAQEKDTEAAAAENKSTEKKSAAKKSAKKKAAKKK